MSSETRVTHYGLNGRATNVFDIFSEKLGFKKGPLVAKCHWAEISHDSEQDTSEKVHEIAQEEADVEGYAPEMAYCRIFWDARTLDVRKHLGGARALRLIVFQKSMPITTLAGDEFLKCWWDTVTCHVALWKSGVRHRDVSPSNLTYRRQGNEAIGVLDDFGHSSSGNERTGTPPFIACDLLDKEVPADDTIPHVYAHDAESFVWVLLWIAIRYEDGKLRDPRHRAFDAWLKVDARGCCEKKAGLLMNFSRIMMPLSPGRGHELNWRVAYGCLRSFRQSMFERQPATPVPHGMRMIVVDDGWEKPFNDILKNLVYGEPKFPTSSQS